jgi:hypothetical protein
MNNSLNYCIYLYSSLILILNDLLSVGIHCLINLSLMLLVLVYLYLVSYLISKHTSLNQKYLLIIVLYLIMVIKQFMINFFISSLLMSFIDSIYISPISF